MDDIQSYTDKLRKTYRHSLDVVLPFTNQEAVVYCNDEEFESLLDKKHSVKDLQTCIYLLERHIDLQQEIIQGLTHLQDLHKYDEQTSEYNTITDKLLTAQNKLAMLRSRAVRCLTKQIQQRCGDANMQLPRWSTSTEKDISRDSVSDPCPNGTITQQTENHSDEITTIVKSENLTSTNYENLNGLEKTSQENVDFERSNNVNENNRHFQDAIDGIENHQSENPDEQGFNGSDTANGSQLLNEDKLLLEAEASARIATNSLQENQVVESPQTGFTTSVSETRKDEMNKTVTDETLSETLSLIESDNCKRMKTDFENTNEGKVNNSEQHSIEPRREDTSVQLFLNVSKSSQNDREASHVSSRHHLEPVEEKVTVEVLQSSVVDEVNYAEYNASKFVEKKKEEEVTSSMSNTKTMSWDPSLLIKRILGKVKPIKTGQLDTSDDEVIHMAGYLEKLPVNKKKATLLKSWRKRYFKIFNGKLFYFEDHRSAAPISFIKLGGCTVSEMGNKCLEVVEDEESGGKVLIIRCGTWPELQDWRRALESEAKTKIKQQHFELVQEKKPMIIIDLGSSSIKAGFLEEQTWPQVILPSVYAVNRDDSKHRFYGYEALNPLVRNSARLVYPLRSPLTIGKSLLDPNDLIGFLEIIFKELQVDLNNYQIVMTTPVNLRDQDKERLVEILFDYFQVGAVYMKCQTILSMYSYSSTCGIIVNIGDHIDVVPVEEGYVVESGVKSLPFGGGLATDHFSRLMASSGYRYFTEVESYIAEYLKVKTCYVSADFAKETEEFSEIDCLTVDMSEFDLPSGDKFVTVAKERFTAFEGLFQPDLWGKDTPGLPDLVYDAVMACSIDSRKELCRNIFLSGATTKIPGFMERLQTELRRKFPSSLVIQIHAAPDRQFAAFIGAAVLASLETFQDLCITRDEWEETGPELLKKWDGV
ncbi:uncharacterized protein LOC114521861 [Dendronephthya gigantea]|uniref:uncharacterized protein LOC114521861 n=1 Tax=Dendronephthya gigantea TaxID=151771 RepID=UPI00106B57C6|nr:uncharacterized protein LOC114521861 [Dendronephthya gigantea]XP_028398231.1 uncharacterized protein LOC114521861 [Dendronephthya gigantea]